MSGARLVVDGGRRERLRTERQVEDAGGLVGQDEPDREQRVDPSERQALEDCAEDFVHAAPVAVSGGSVDAHQFPEPDGANDMYVGVPNCGASVLKHTHGFDFWPQIETSLPFSTFV